MYMLYISMSIKTYTNQFTMINVHVHIFISIKTVCTAHAWKQMMDAN